MARVLISAANLIFSFTLGLLALAALYIYSSPTLETLLENADVVRTWLLGLGLHSDYNVWFRFFLGGEQLVLMGATILMRVVLAIILTAGAWVLGFDNR